MQAERSSRNRCQVLMYGLPERTRRERELRLVRAALERYGLWGSRLGLRSRSGLRSVRITPLSLTRNYKSVFRLASFRYGVFGLYMYRLPRGGPAREAELLRSWEGLRSYEGRSTEVALRSQLAWMQALEKEAKARVPGPVPTLGGALTCDVFVPEHSEGRRCALLRWAPGKPRGGGRIISMTRRELSAVGSYIASIHRHSEGFMPEYLSHSFVRPRWDWDSVFGESAAIWERGERFYSASLMEVFRAAAEKTARSLKEIGEEPEVFGLIHGDLLPKNLLIRRERPLRRAAWMDRVQAVDFDHCGWGHYMFDLAWTLRGITGQGTLHGDAAPSARREALLEGYLEERPVPGDQLSEQLSVGSALRAVEMVNRVLLWTGPEVRPWGPGFLSNALRELEAFLEN